MNTAGLLVGNGAGLNYSLRDQGRLGSVEAAREDRIIRKRILLVEDERVAREMIGRLLSRDEHTVVEANNGAEAFSLFIGNEFDLVVTDYELPFLNGNELAARIKQLAPNQPILMITAHRKRPGPDNPVDAVLDKPVKLDGLRRAMIRLLAEAGRCFAS